jgi:hypothetical protein
LPLIAPLVALVCATPALAQAKEERKERFHGFLRENSAQFPLVEMKRAEIPFATVHTLPPREKPLEYDGKFYTGFRFTAPEWLDGPVMWMFAYPVPDEEVKGMNWYILPEDPVDVNFQLFHERRENTRFPRFRALFPDCGSFTQQYFPNKDLIPSKNYIIWFGLPSKKFPPLKFALTVSSARGLFEYGMLPTGYPAHGPGRAFMKSAGLKPKPPAEILSAAVATQRKSGTTAALDLLEQELPGYIDAGGDFHKFHLAVWREAQVRSGRTDPAWAASLFEWLQLKNRSLEALLLADDLVTNTTNQLRIVHRYGAANRALEPFFEEMGRRLVDLDPAAHPDRGPALPLLPEVRLRIFPGPPTRGISVIDPTGWVRYSGEMPHSFAGAMGAMAEFERLGGNWKKSLERNFAACDWIERKRASIAEPENYWYKHRMDIAATLMMLGLTEAADAEYDAILKKGWPDVYQNRTLIRARHQRLAIRITLGDADRALLVELDEIHEKLRNNPLVHSGSWKEVEITKARCLARLDRQEEALSLLSKLAEEGNHSARIERIRLLLDAGTAAPATVEAELQAVLQNTRDWGRKIDEGELYSLYARFLDQSGRLGEALAMQREAVRLARAFDLFPKLPGELARLSVLLARSGDATGTDAAAAEAGELAANKERIPPRIAKEVTDLLTTRVPPASGNPAPPKIATDLQPLRSLVIPVKGRPLRGKLTLTNPSAQAVEGTLAFDGIPADATWDAGTGEALVKLGTAGSDRLSKVRIEPGSFALIELSALPDAISKGTLTTVWSSPGQPDRQSVWSFDPAEEGISSAVIEAGEFKSNPFYSIPIHHHFMQAGDSKLPANFRITAAAAARVELYDAGDRLIAVDANGNGSFGESGDSLFSDTDADGTPDFTAPDSEISFRIQVYPSAEIPAGGLSLKLESKIAGQWIAVAEDRILP